MLNCLGTRRLNCLGKKRPSWLQNHRSYETIGNLAINRIYQKLMLLYSWNFFTKQRDYHWLLWGHMTSNNKIVGCVKFLI